MIATREQALRCKRVDADTMASTLFAALAVTAFLALAHPQTAMAGNFIRGQGQPPIQTGELREYHRPSSGFGPRRDPLNDGQKFHRGIDIAKPAGTRVFAWADGVVLKAGRMGAYGLAVDILHAGGVKTRYAHLQTIQVRRGQMAQRGQNIGSVGRTGRATGPNLHFEVQDGNRLADPWAYLRNGGPIVEDWT